MGKIIGSIFVTVILVIFCITNLLISDSVLNCLIGGGCLVVATIWAYLSMMYIHDYRAEKKRQKEYNDILAAASNVFGTNSEEVIGLRKLLDFYR